MTRTFVVQVFAATAFIACSADSFAPPPKPQPSLDAKAAGSNGTANTATTKKTSQEAAAEILGNSTDPFAERPTSTQINQTLTAGRTTNTEEPSGEPAPTQANGQTAPDQTCLTASTQVGSTAQAGSKCVMAPLPPEKP